MRPIRNSMLHSSSIFRLIAKNLNSAKYHHDLALGYGTRSGTEIRHLYL